MADFKPNTPYNVPFFLLIPTTTTTKGIKSKTFEGLSNPFYCSFRTFGGTEKMVNDILSVEDTAVIETWFTPLITPDCNVEIDGRQFEILGTPENINMRNQYMVFKVRAIKGGA